MSLGPQPLPLGSVTDRTDYDMTKDTTNFTG